MLFQRLSFISSNLQNLLFAINLRYLIHNSDYYGATYLPDAEVAAKAIRFHWHIENKNHYVRDVSLGEDASRIRKNQVSNIKEALFENVLNFDNLLNYQGIF